ncbi:hypothetical protein GA0070560_12024 [Micromonospora halophytica]|uniref:Uncharacterized protein n=1 Tax=Micromonospora halophytica TaxID=47864 RepID=A0A1C5J216_9ACTN|nr:hypothetical protein GA0070560_12024 [Micromonospora halophytica]
MRARRRGGDTRATTGELTGRSRGPGAGAGVGSVGPGAVRRPGGIGTRAAAVGARGVVGTLGGHGGNRAGRRAGRAGHPFAQRGGWALARRGGRRAAGAGPTGRGGAATPARPVRARRDGGPGGRAGPVDDRERGVGVRGAAGLTEPVRRPFRPVGAGLAAGRGRPAGPAGLVAVGALAVPRRRVVTGRAGTGDAGSGRSRAGRRNRWGVAARRQHGLVRVGGAAAAGGTTRDGRAAGVPADGVAGRRGGRTAPAGSGTRLGDRLVGTRPAHGRCCGGGARGAAHRSRSTADRVRVRRVGGGCGAAPDGPGALGGTGSVVPAGRCGTAAGPAGLAL